MQRLKMSLASSEELKVDREQFEIAIHRLNKSWVDKGIFIELMMWEDFLDAMSPIGLQQEYNKAVSACDIFVMLYWSKVGPYTMQEFEHAFGAFKQGGKPIIYLYFKDATHTNTREEDRASLAAFQTKVLELGHFPTKYKNTEDLVGRIAVQMQKLWDRGMIQRPKVAASTPASQEPQYQIGNIIRLLTAAFSPLEFEDFTMTYYGDVHRQFTPGSMQPQRVQLLVTHCKTRLLLSQLLEHVRVWNAPQYEQHGPYTLPS